MKTKTKNEKKRDESNLNKSKETNALRFAFGV